MPPKGNKRNTRRPREEESSATASRPVETRAQALRHGTVAEHTSSATGTSREARRRRLDEPSASTAVVPDLDREEADLYSGKKDLGAEEGTAAARVGRSRDVASPCEDADEMAASCSASPDEVYRPLTDAEVMEHVEHQLAEYKARQLRLQELHVRRQSSMHIANIIAASEDPNVKHFPVVRLVVGGEPFMVPIITLLCREPDSYFHTLLTVQSRPDEAVVEYFAEMQRIAQRGGAAAAQQPEQQAGSSGAAATATVDASGSVMTPRHGGSHAHSASAAAAQGEEGKASAPQHGTGLPESLDLDDAHDAAGRVRRRHRAALTATDFPAEVFTDAKGAIFIDRDPSTFRHILNYLRGYNRFHMLDEEELRKLRVDAKYFRLQGLQEILGEDDPSMDLRFQPGPGVNMDRTRFRVVYSIATIGNAFMVTGRHSITFQVLCNDYVGVGLVSDSFANTDAEFHKTLNCAIYYMSGVFYTNYPNYRKEEGFARFENGDYVTLMVDMDKGFAEVKVRQASKVFSIGTARRLKFAVTMKLASKIRIVPPEEAEEQLRRIAQEAEGTGAATTAGATTTAADVAGIPATGGAPSVTLQGQGAPSVAASTLRTGGMAEVPPPLPPSLALRGNALPASAVAIGPFRPPTHGGHIGLPGSPPRRSVSATFGEPSTGVPSPVSFTTHRSSASAMDGSHPLISMPRGGNEDVSGDAPHGDEEDAEAHLNLGEEEEGEYYEEGELEDDFAEDYIEGEEF